MAMKIFELTRPAQHHNAEDLLRRAGYHHMGTGAFGRVWRKPDKNFVVKLFKEDPCYASYVRLIKQHSDNPHFPKVIGPIMKIGKETPNTYAYYGVRLELLSRENPDDYYDQTQNSIYGFIRLVREYLYNPNIVKNQDYYEEYILLFNHYPRLKEALNLLYQFSNTHVARAERPCRVDIKIPNILMRGDIPVFTDPVA